MLLLILAPALWNGFPLIFPDTGGYFTAPLVRELANGRSALYGAFLIAGIPLYFWPNVIAQAVLMIWLFAVSLRLNGLGGRPWLLLGIVALLCIATALPWFAGQLMPDILFPAAILALYLLAYRDGHLGRWERWLLAAVIAFAMASHMAAAGMCVAVVIALWLLSLIPRLNLPRARMTFAAGAVAGGILLCPLSNVALTGSFAFTPGGSTFLFGRLIEDGIVARYLEDRCPDPALRICAYQAELPESADPWLWGNSPLYKLGGWQAYEPEARRIIRETLVNYPVMHFTTAIKAALAQFLRFATELNVNDNWTTYDSFKDYIPQLRPALMAARQQTERFDVSPLNRLHVPVGYLSLAALGLAIMMRRRLGIAPETYALCVTLLLALAANAVICGVFSHPVDRYQGRLMLLAPFVVAIMAMRRLRASGGV